MKTLLIISGILCALLSIRAATSETKYQIQIHIYSNMLPQMKLLNEKKISKKKGGETDNSAEMTPFSFCPDGWFSYGSRCFKFINSPKSWISAEEYCNSLGGNLASVANPREYSFLQQMTQTAGRTTAWLGGFWLQNQWLWIDREGFYYTNWYSQSSSSTYSCLYLQSAYGWSNTQCTSSNPFICSKNAFGC
ncbi:regenerating islet-derived protein 4 [Sarotherodon galilaeus]